MPARHEVVLSSYSGFAGPGCQRADSVGVRAKDDLTLEIQLEQPIGYFPNLVALWVVPPPRQDIIESAGARWAQDPQTYLGNGPFKMTEWVHQDRIAINNSKPPLNNQLVRRALSRAIDREAMIRDVASGVGKPATSMIPPGMPGHQPELGRENGFDPAAARELLKQAGFTDPAQFPQLRFRFATTTANQTRAEFIQAQLKDNLGINIVLDSMEAKAFQAAYKDKDYDLSWTGWGADYPDPQNWMTGLFGCEASNNKYNYCNSAFDQVAGRGDTGTDPNARLQVYAEAQQTLVTDLPVVPLFYRGRMVLVKPWVQNLVITAKDDYPGLNLIKQAFVTDH